jgi:hypothetical protein
MKMFDSYEIHRAPASVNVYHTEKRAPTDQSVALLREMESAAKASVVESMCLESANLKAVVHKYESMLDLTTTFQIHYAINGCKRIVTVVLHDSPTKIQDRVDKIWKAVAEDIAAFLLENFTKGVRP